MLEWVNENAAVSIILTIVTGVFSLGIMHGSALRWLKMIAARLDRHVRRNEEQHDGIFIEQRASGERVARLETKVDTLCDKR